jgi:hypothetical protein
LITAKAELVHTYFCDVSKPVRNRQLLDTALEEALTKKTLHYGFKHAHNLVNRIKKATKDVHQKVVTIYKSVTDPDMKTIVESAHFQGYLYDEGSCDPDENAWEFSLGPKHQPLPLTNLSPSHTKSIVSTPSTGLVKSSDGTRLSSRIMMTVEQKRVAAIEEAKRQDEERTRKFEEAQRFAEEQELLRRQEKKDRKKEEAKRKEEEERKRRVEEAKSKYIELTL